MTDGPQDIKPTKFTFDGGCVTAKQSASVAPGFSMVQNMRQRTPGHTQRAGQAYLHTTADSTNRPLTEFQFTDKGGNVHFIAQMSDGDFLLATTAAPGITTGVFGSELFSGAATPNPASYCEIDDMLFFSTGVDQHKVWVGNDRPVQQCIVVKGGAATIPAIPNFGYDYSLEAKDGRASTLVILDALDTYANGDCFLVRTDVPEVKQFDFTVPAVNGTASTLTLWKWNGAWTSLAITDGTQTGGDTTLGQTGSVTCTAPTDVIPKYAFGTNGFWWLFKVSAQLDAEVEVSAITYEADVQDIFNLWDGIPMPAIEVMLYNAADYFTYAYDYVVVSEAASTWKIYFRTTELIEAFYVDVGQTPNTEASTIDGFAFWTGEVWTEAAPTNDGTAGLSKSGWVVTGRKAAEKTQFEDTAGYGYWWYFTVSATLSADLNILIETMPYYNITNFGNIGNVNCNWKNRLALTFNLFPKDIYVSLKRQPFCFNDSTGANEAPILQPGDGRPNEVTCMLSFFNEIVVFQKEQDTMGGCVTMFQGDSGPTWGPLVLSTNLGTFNAKSAIVVEGALTSMNTQKPVAKVIYFISRLGVVACTGELFSGISDDIQNYFRPIETECIRRGYETEHWIGYDSAENVVRIGIVNGTARSTSTATSTTGDKLVDTTGAFTTDGTAIGDTVSNTTDGTTALITAIDSASTLSIDTDIMADEEVYSIYAGVPNVFPIYNPSDKTGHPWSFDALAQALSCFAEVSAGTGDTPIIQVGGITGYVVRLNTGTNDVTTKIDAHTILDLGGAQDIVINNGRLRTVAQTGNVTVTPYENGVAQTAVTVPMASLSSGVIRKANLPVTVSDSHVALKFQNNTVSQEITLMDVLLYMQGLGK